MLTLESGEAFTASGALLLAHTCLVVFDELFAEIEAPTLGMEPTTLGDLVRHSTNGVIHHGLFRKNIA